MVMAVWPDYDWLAAQTQLVFLHSKFENQFTMELPADTQQISRPIAVTEVDPETIPTFDCAESIDFQHHWNVLRTSEIIRCSGKIHQIRYNRGTEPILIPDTSDPTWRSVASKLTMMWINLQSKRIDVELNNIAAMFVTWPEYPIEPTLEESKTRSQEEAVLVAAWEALKVKFEEVASHFQQNISSQKIALARNNKVLIDDGTDIRARKKLMLEIEKQLPGLAVRQQITNSNIQYIRGIYVHFFYLVKKSNKPELQRIIQMRVTQFHEQVNEFARANLGDPTVANKFKKLFNDQVQFYEQFNPDQIALCNELLCPADISLHGLKWKPTSEKITSQLTKLLRDPSASWDSIRRGILTLKVEQGRLIRTIRPRMDTLIVLKKLLQDTCFNGAFDEGLDKETGKIVYSREIYIRIVTLQRDYATLKAEYATLSQENYEKIRRNFEKHSNPIFIETNAIKLNAERLLFTGHKMNDPWLNNKGEFLSYTEWETFQRSK